jgi:twinkle protein
VPQIIERLEKLVLTRGINGAIIDPWNRLEALRPNGMTETEYVAWALNQFSRFAKRHNVAMFIICHPHKMPEAKFGEEEPIPSPYQIAGSAHWYNMSDYIIGIGRNKYTEPKNMATVEIQKVREEGISGNLGRHCFFYDGRSRRFHDDEHSIPLQPGTASYTGMRKPVPQLGMLQAAD